MFKITVLGKYGPYPKAGGSCSSYLIQSDDANILIDMGSGSLSNLQKFIDIKDIDLIIFTHLHSDHMGDALVLQYALKSNAINKKCVYMPGSPQNIFLLINEMEEYDVNLIKDDMIIQTLGLNFSFKKMEHSVESYAVKVSNGKRIFVFSADTVFNNHIIKFSQGANVLLFDCAILEQDRTVYFPHSSAYQAAYVAKMADVDCLLLTHINPKADETKLLKEALETYNKSIIVEELKTYEI